VLCQGRVGAAHTREVGRALAAMHRSGSALASAYGPGRFRFEDLCARVERIAHADDARIARQAPALLSRLEEVHAARAQGLPRGLAHGDLFRDNVLFVPDEPKVAALLDFESAYEGPLVYDVMVTILAWCTGDTLDFDLARALVEGYESERPLSEEERAHAYDEARFGCMRFWITRVTDYAMRLGFGNGRDPLRFALRLNAIESAGREGFRARLFA
jgi:homoserine kinase type II